MTAAPTHCAKRRYLESLAVPSEIAAPTSLPSMLRTLVSNTHNIKPTLASHYN
jgi:hypothetical protein